MKIPSIFVGCGKFGLQRLQALAEKTEFTPVACVDKNIKRSRKQLEQFNFAKKFKLYDKVYPSLKKALQNHKASACFIFVAADQHFNLIAQSLRSNLHTYCVKPIAIDKVQFKKITKIKKKKKKLQFLQGYNNQWNESALYMKHLINEKKEIGKIIGGQCICWGRQNLKQTPAHIEMKKPGMFYLTLACHQLSQLVAINGLPNYVTSYVHTKIDKDIGQLGIFGTAGGQCIFEYPEKKPFTYTGSRAAHGNPYGFASRWSGQWIIHGEKGDIKRDGGRITVFKNGQVTNDVFLKDLDFNLIEDEKNQFTEFYHMIKGDKKNNKRLKKIQKDSMDTWILMEACNESARLNKKISIKKFKASLLK